MFKRVTLASMFVLALCLGGCGAQPGKTLQTWGRGDTPPPLMEAPEAGAYRLFASNSPNAKYTVRLERGEQLGFRKNDAGKTVAVAKDKEIPLEETLATSYYWKIEEEE